MSEPAPRLGVDIGGTFTDVALDCGGRLHTAKVLTTPRAPEQGVMTAIVTALRSAGIRAGDLGAVIHGTTLATNALLERKGPRTAFLTTAGFRDLIEIRQENRFDQYDLDIDLPPPLMPRRWRLPIRERMDASGRVLLPLETADVEAAIPVLQQAEIASVAVGFLHSFTNPDHERRVGDLLARHLPGVPVTLSAEVSPEMREYERFTTACANAYVQPLMSRYLRQLECDLQAAGVRCPLLLMTSGGGLTTVETASRFPVRLIESGPAGGAIFAAGIARRCGIEKMVSFDMGGTTAKICLIDHARPQTNRVFEAARLYRFKKGSGYPLRIPVIEMVEIGAGGGSIARCDTTGRIAIGPDSAGAEPGPACYNRGGEAPTVTDADLVLGRINPAGFSAGAMALNGPAAAGALTRKLGESLGLSAEFAALGVSEMVDENMANAARVHTTESGKSVGERTLVAFGGAAPLHAARVAEKLGVRRILVPAHAGVGSAIGFLQAPIAHEIIRSGLQRLSCFDVAAVNRILAETRAEAAAFVRRGAPAGSPLAEERSAFMRYRGQGHEIQVALPVRDYTAADVDVLRTAFEEAYRKLHGRAIPGVDVEILSWVIAVRAGDEVAPARPLPAKTGPAEPAAHRRVFDPARGEFVRTPIYRRRDLCPGQIIAGPAVIEEDETSTVVSPVFNAQLTGFGDIELTRHELPDPRRTQADHGAFSAIRRQIMWTRLIAVVEEQAQTLIRTAFSTPVREAGDLSAGVFDRRGRMVAQAVTGTPGHVNSMANAVMHFLALHPIDTMQPGDHFLTNDPWLASGHLHDFTVVTPAFRNGRAIALFANTTHVVDIGGLGMGPDGRQVFEEGLCIPIMRLASAGHFNAELLSIVRANVREPLQVEGDLYAMAACNDEGCHRLAAMLDEYRVDDIEELSDWVIDSSRAAMHEAIGRLPKGVYRNALTMDGYDKPLTLAAALTVGDRGIHVDFAGTSLASSYGINVVMNYTLAYTAFGVRCLVGPEVPNNAGSLEPITVTAPEGCVLNAKRPWPVAARHTVGHLLPDVVFGCLASAIPGGVPAEGASSLWNPQIYGGGSMVDEVEAGVDPSTLPQFSTVIFHCGGSGARPGKDGLSATAFPSGVRTIPIEAIEAIAPIVFWRREFREGSGGAGKFRGGLGQVIELSGAAGMPISLLCNFERVKHPARGRSGGENGAPGCVSLLSGRPFRPKGRQTIPPRDRARLELPGGAGFGPPTERNPHRVAEDVLDGLISRETAARLYHVALTPDGQIDAIATAALRATAAAPPPAPGRAT